MGTNMSQNPYYPINSDGKIVQLINFARVGNLPMLKYFHSVEPDKWACNVQNIAYLTTIHGYANCLKFALETGAEPDRILFANALKCSNVQCLQTIIKLSGLKFYIEHDAMTCAEFGLIDNLKCLYDSGIIFDLNELKASQFYNHKECIEYIESVLFK